MENLEGKVAFITGAARGQGRQHAISLAERGVDIIALDLCAQIPAVEYPMSTPHDFEQTVQQVHDLGGRILAITGDVRDPHTVQNAVQTGVDQFGRLDIVLANAGIMPTTGEPSTHLEAWSAAIDTMLSGVYYTLYYAMTPMINAGNGGSMIITSSVAGLAGVAYNTDLLNPGEIGYGAAKHGVIGIMRNFARALGPHHIRVNTIHPMGVRTPMVVNEHFAKLKTTVPDGWMNNVMNLDLIEPIDITNAILWLASDAARYVTGTTLPVDAGTLL